MARYWNCLFSDDMYVRSFSYCLIRNFRHLHFFCEYSWRNIQKIVPRCPPCLYLFKYCVRKKMKYFGDIRSNYKFKSLILCSECVTCNDILKQGLEELHFTEEWREIKLVITAVRNTHFIVCWCTDRNTDLQKGNVIVCGENIVIFMYDYTCNIMKSSTRIGESGARPHTIIARIIPVDNKILLFILCTHLLECYK